MNRKMSRTAHAVDPELADANVKLATVEDEKRELTKANKQKDDEVEKLKQQLTEAEKRFKAVEDATTAAVTPLQTELTQLREKCEKADRTAQEAKTKAKELEQQLGNAMDGTMRMQTELKAAREECETYRERNSTLTREMEAALKDLGDTKTTLTRQTQKVTELENEKAQLTTDREKLSQELRELLEKRAAVANAARDRRVGWSHSSELWLTGALSACGTAVAVSFFFMKYYTTS